MIHIALSEHSLCGPWITHILRGASQDERTKCYNGACDSDALTHA